MPSTSNDNSQIPQEERNPARAKNEIDFGVHLAQGDTEKIWGWGTPAGKLRAQRRADKIIEGASLRPGTYALEIGCGTGLFTEKFAVTGSKILAVDISPELLEKARARGLPSDRVEFVAERFEDIQKPQVFDAAIGSSVLHHLDLIKSLETIKSLLKPGGVLSFAEPNMLNPQVFMERKFRFLKIFSHTSPDETAFVRWRLKKLLSEMGFVDIRIEPFDWLHPFTPEFFIPIVRGIGKGLEKIPGLREFSGSLYIFARLP